MYIRTFSLLLLFSTFLFRISSAQVGINTDDPNSSAILEIFSNDKGVLFPKITDTSSLNVTNGLFYYNGNNNRFYYYNASKSNWQCINPLNSTDPSQITASNNLKVNSDLTVKNNQTVKNKLTVEDILEVTNVMEANQSIITLKKKVDLNDEMSVQNNFTVEQGEVNVNNGDISVNNGYRIKGKGSIPKGTILMWKGNTSQNFNSSGKGINDLEGWAICNGNTHGTFTTPNLTDRFIKAGTQSSLGANSNQYNNSQYYIDAENGCEPWRNSYVIEQTYYEGSPSGMLEKTRNDSIKAHSYQHAKTLLGWRNCNGGYQQCDTRLLKKKNNPDYYRSKNSCKTSNQVDTDYYSLLFIIRI